MFAVIFEVQPKQERFDDYLALAKSLKPKLEAIDGFVDVDRFASARTAGRILSLSIWRDEKAVIRWRTHAEHHGAQERGRFGIFEDYRLRVGEITADSASTGAPAQQRFDETQIGDARAMTISVVAPRPDGAAAKAADLAAQLGLRGGADGLADHEAWESIYTPGKLLLLAAWRDAAAAKAWIPARPAGAPPVHQRAVRIIRDYGMFERREAPQFYLDVKPSAGAQPVEARCPASR
ncbi:MAG TPA: antibiotic biosynthesis monooxygenase [Xanthobacteraceae bacterium]|jgi:heme-degrading monooxygenase HmoA